MLKHRVKNIKNSKVLENGERHFEVEWENTWEDEESLRNLAPSILEEFLLNEEVSKSQDKDDDIISAEEASVSLKTFDADQSKGSVKRKGINDVISRLQKSRQDATPSPDSSQIQSQIQSRFDYDKPNEEEMETSEYAANLPSSPLEGFEATAGEIPQICAAQENPPHDLIITPTSPTSNVVTPTSPSSTIENLKSNVENITKLFPDITTVTMSTPITNNQVDVNRPQQLFPATVTLHPGQKIIYKCTLCSECFYEESKFKQHVFMHEQVNILKNDPPKLLSPSTFKCKFCTYVFNTAEKLKIHYNEMHEKDLLNSQPLDQLYQCSICHDTFLDFTHFTVHQQTSHQRKNEVFILPKSQASAAQVSGQSTLLIATTIPANLISTMSNPTVIPKPSEAFQKVEDQSSKQPSMTTLNFQPVNEALLSKAVTMPTTVTSSASLETISVDQTIEPRKHFRCNICDELFPTESDRAKHSLIHVSRNSSLDCHICGKQFRHRTNLSTHLIVHSGVKPHQCNICLRRFTQKVNLQRHMHIHDGSRPFSCRMCRKSFTQKANLQRHILSHTEHSKEELLQALNSIPNESEVNNAINESLVEALQVVRSEDTSIKSHSVKSTATELTSVASTDNDHKSPTIYKCDVCDKMFAQKINLTKHMLIHSGARPFQCYVCGKSFRQKLSLQKHYIIHTSGSNSFMCQTCNRFFVSRTNLQRHMLAHVAGNTNQCHLCDRKFTSTDMLERHFSEHIEETTPSIALPQKYFEQTVPGQTYKCSHCDIVFDSPMIFSKHLQCHQNGFPSANQLAVNNFNDNAAKVFEENQDSPLPCTTCGLIFMSASKLEAHMLTHTENAMKIDNESNDNVSLDTDITKAMTEAVKAVEVKMIPSSQSEVISPTNAALQRSSRCPVCKEIFPSKEAMQEHYADIHLDLTVKPRTSVSTSSKEEAQSIKMEDDDEEEEEEEDVATPNLDEFASLVNEDEERLIKENEEFIKDNIVGGSEEYESKGRYERGSYVCRICNRELTYKYSLEKHMLLHTDSYPYPCHLCSKRFNHKASLDKHITVHNGEKPFQCHICSRPFSQRSNLQRHMLTHSQNRDFACETCGKRFNHMASLKTHMLIHTGDKPFSCYICTKRFNQKGNLKRHIQTHRNGKRNKINGTENDEEFEEMLNISLEAAKEVENGMKQEYTNLTERSYIDGSIVDGKRIIIKKQSADFEYNFNPGDDNDQLPTMIEDTKATAAYQTGLGGDYDADTILTVVPSDVLERETKIDATKVTLKKKVTFHCDSCSKLFSSMQSLETHKKSAHAQIICDVCGKQFSQKANLLKHKLIHLNKKPFKCRICEKAFRQKANLQRHELIHDKARKAVNCENCKKSFRCPWSLKQHIKLYACKAKPEVKNE